MPLSDAACRKAKPGERPVKLSDGGGLHLLVDPRGARYWRLAYRFAGKQKTLALGVYPAVSLADARAAREAAKRALSQGIDPSRARREEKRAAELSAENTFETLTREWHANQTNGWTPGYAKQVMARFEADVFPEIGTRSIAEIEAPELLDMLRKVEARGALDIAKRLLQTVGQVFRYAVATGRARRNPAADLKGALKSAGRPQHHRAMPREELTGFLQALSTYDGDPRTRLALRLITLTFVRTIELRAARWDEFNLDAQEWRIPAERMKMRAPHIVPLSRQAVETLKELRPLSGNSPFLFPSKGTEGYMSNNTMLYALYRMGYHRRATVHGFRGVASTLLHEMGFHQDWIERQLAHDERNKVRAAYNHAQYLAERRQMMQHWADYLDGLRPMTPYPSSAGANKRSAEINLA